jgi:hypothetical protein
LPEEDFDPSQSPDAVQDVESVDVQVKVVELPTYTEVGSALIEVVGLGVDGGAGVGDSPPPPPPPPPHDVIKIEVRIVVNKNLVLFIIIMCFYSLQKIYHTNKKIISFLYIINNDFK